MQTNPSQPSPVAREFHQLEDVTGIHESSRTPLFATGTVWLLIAIAFFVIAALSLLTYRIVF
jgi:hypothetical protein